MIYDKVDIIDRFCWEFIKKEYVVTDEQIDYIFDFVDGLCKDKKWDEINQLLIEADKDCSLLLRISWLTITSCVKSKLPYRSTFFLHTEEIAKLAGKNEKLLEGLQ